MSNTIDERKGWAGWRKERTEVPLKHKVRRAESMGDRRERIEKVKDLESQDRV